MNGLYDWHDSSCGFAETQDIEGKPLTLPCDCGFPDLFRGAWSIGWEAGMTEAKRRLSLVGMHDAKCAEPDKPCTCGLDKAIDTPDPTPWNEPMIEPR